MQVSIEASLVRIHAVEGHIVGAGFLVGERHILTCAHVIGQALDLAGSPVDPPSGVVLLDFPRISPRMLLAAKIVLWCPPLPDGSGDLVGLELEREPPIGAERVRFAPVEDVWKHDFSVLGFPEGYDDGVWATGRLLRRQATNWIQIEDIKAQGFAVGSGFSGTPVWDEQLQGVVGMVVAASRPADTRTAFVIPLDVLAAAWTLLTIPPGQPRNPYKGLRPFMQRDAADFFGREAVTGKVVELVNFLVKEQTARSSTRLLTVLGPSGVGKSSLVMAGVLPRLQSGVLPGSKDWVYLDPIVPGKHPFETLTSILKPRFPDTSFKTLLGDLENDDARGLHLLAMQLAKESGTRVVLLIDQFEELFTQTESEDERQRFIRLLLNACKEPRGAMIALLTLRADFYDRPMQYPELFRIIADQHLSLLAIGPDDLRRVVEQPAALPDVQVTFEGDLANRLLFEVQGQVGGLPLMQFTLDQLFQKRSGRLLTLSAYRELGGVKGALTSQAEETYAALPSEEHCKLARALFVRLIDPGASEQDTTRRRASLGEFIFADVSQTRLMRETIDAFITARLLTTNEIAGTMTIEVSHEALIREWPRLAGWLREARDDIRLQQTISKDAADWEQRGKPRDRLYRGSQLKEAQVWARSSTPSGNEVAFLRAGTVRRMLYVASVTMIVLLLLSTSGIAGWFLTRPDPTHVTTLNDDGPGSLSQAIASANPGSTITFDASLRGIIPLSRGDQFLDKNLTIRGPGANLLSISSGKSGHIVFVFPGTTVTIIGLAFKKSNTNNGFIYNKGTLILNNSTISGNMATTDGGGIFNQGTLILNNSTISGSNEATDGGGIYNDYGTLTLLTNSTVSGNTAQLGGGIYNHGGALTLINSTVSGNTAQFDGGGLLIQSDVSADGAFIAQVDLTFSTIYGNIANGGGDIAVKDYAYGVKQATLVRISNSIIAGDPVHPGPDIVGMLTSVGYNLFQNHSSPKIVPVTRTQHGPDKFLSVNDLTKLFASSVLQDNGGPTNTLKLAPDSPAVDQIPLGACHIKVTSSLPVISGEFVGGLDFPTVTPIIITISSDQRGMKRPDVNEDNKDMNKCDIGAYEYQDAPT